MFFCHSHGVCCQNGLEFVSGFVTCIKLMLILYITTFIVCINISLYNIKIDWSGTHSQSQKSILRYAYLIVSTRVVKFSTHASFRFHQRALHISSVRRWMYKYWFAFHEVYYYGHLSIYLAIVQKCFVYRLFCK